MPPRPSTMDRNRFIATFGGVFENSPWIAEAAFDAGLTSADDTAQGLHARMCAILAAASHDRKLALLRAHPDLAGRLAVAGALTAESTAEQASAGLDRCTPDEFARFADLNARYVARFAFPFILAVRGRTRAEILATFEGRLLNTPEQEFATALLEVERIAGFRLQELLPN